MTGLIHETKLTPGERRTEAEKLYDAEVLARVKKGIALLEERVGPDWVESINLATLDLGHGARCILGQVYAEEFPYAGLGRYAEAEARLGIPAGYEYGFDLDEDEADDWDAEDVAAEYRRLQAVWEGVLTPLVEKR